MTPTPSDTDREAFAARVRAITDSLATMLIEKNAAYGNSALDPVRIFSKADPVEQLRVRIDDKLSRLVRGAAAGEDVVTDLLGYLVLLKLAEADAPRHGPSERERLMRIYGCSPPRCIVPAPTRFSVDGACE